MTRVRSPIASIASTSAAQAERCRTPGLLHDLLDRPEQGRVDERTRGPVLCNAISRSGMTVLRHQHGAASAACCIRIGPRADSFTT